jgi:hypothetical protein
MPINLEKNVDQIHFLKIHLDYIRRRVQIVQYHYIRSWDFYLKMRRIYLRDPRKGKYSVNEKNIISGVVLI